MICDVINGGDHGGIVIIRVLRTRLPLVIRVNYQGDKAAPGQLQRVGHLGFLGALETGRDDHHRGFILRCRVLGPEKIRGHGGAVLAGNLEIGDLNIAAVGLHQGGTQGTNDNDHNADKKLPAIAKAALFGELFWAC